MRPVIINNVLHSARILGDGCAKFLEYSVKSTSLNNDRISGYVDNSVMLVTALSPVIGYQNAAHIAEAAVADNTTVREAALASGKVTAEQFDSNRQAHQRDRRRTRRRVTIPDTSDLVSADRVAEHRAGQDNGRSTPWAGGGHNNGS
jgi:aspartate ammonia-lyase